MPGAVEIPTRQRIATKRYRPLLYSYFGPRDEHKILSVEMIASSNMISGHE